VAAFTVLSGELQRNIMEVRRVAVRPLLQKAPRLVRDIATAQGKDIAVELEGERVEVDKSRLDLLDAPLTHLVRNCADHGIEAPADRRAAGKPERGRIAITAGNEDGWFVLTIADDGRGLDLAAIRRKAEALGLVQAGAALTEQAAVDLIFAAGLSTARTVSDVSGRGVGMDVVRTNLAEAGGDIAVSTRPGHGTTFRLRVPSVVTTQIVRAYLVREGDGIYALPLDRVRETFAVGDGTDAGVVLRHGTALPTTPLHRLLGLAAPAATADRRTLISIAHRGRLVALSVAATLGVRQVVIRPITGIHATDLTRRYQGAALLGDGRLALVLDLDRTLAHV
jgi:two-component system chemotaxis sensor kinase CheA